MYVYGPSEPPTRTQTLSGVGSAPSWARNKRGDSLQQGTIPLFSFYCSFLYMLLDATQPTRTTPRPETHVDTHKKNYSVGSNRLD